MAGPGAPGGERVADLLSRMTLEEKIAQLGSVWMGASGDGDGVAPMQDQFFSHDQPPFEELVKNGLGQLTRVFGTRPVTAAAGMSALAALQARVAAASRLGIPAVAHEECLTGFAAWGATIFPTPLAWGAAVRPGAGGRDDGGLRRDDAGGGRAPGSRPGARRDPRLPLGPDRGDHRRGPVPGRRHRHRLRARAAAGRGAGHAQALRRLRGVAGRAEPWPRSRWDRASWPTSSWSRSRWPSAGRRPVGDAELRRHRRRARQRRSPAADHPAARAVRLRRGGRLRLLRGLLPRAAARGRGQPGRGGGARAGGRARRRAARHPLLRRAAARPGRGGRGAAARSSTAR